MGSVLTEFSIFQFSNNVAKFILSIGPQTTKEKGVFQIDLEDDAVQNMLIAYNGEARWPDKIVPFSPPPPPKAATAEVVVLSPEEEKALLDKNSKEEYIQNSLYASVAAMGLVAFGLNGESESAVNMLTTFALAGLAGYQVSTSFQGSFFKCIYVNPNISSSPSRLFGG